MIVSLFNSINGKNTVVNTRKGKETPLKQILTDISIGKYKTQIEELRDFGYRSEQYNVQKLFLPGFTPSGIFPVRKESGLKIHSGILSFDIDDLNSFSEATDIRDAVSLDKFVYGAFISPSGKGVKWFVKIVPEQHDIAWAILREKYELEFGLAVDGSCKDKSRLCFVSFDQEAYMNEECSTFLVTEEERKQLLKQFSISDVKSVVERIKLASIDITSGYENWLKLGFALSKGIGEKGRELFQELSSFHPEYDKNKTDAQFDSCLKNKREGKNITIKSFFYLAKKYGIDIRSSDRTSIRRENGEEITDRERIENAINEIYEIRKNIILDRIECKERASGGSWEPANEDDISRELEFKRVKGCAPTRVRSIINSKFVRRFNPFSNYFEGLLPFDKRVDPDYINLLADIVELKNEQRDRRRFNLHFKKALVRCVACALADGINNLHYNKHAIIFISPLQSIGKSGFIRYLIPPTLDMYCVEKMTFGNRDEQFTMQSSFIINLDEMASIDERNLQSVKSAMSTGMINVRKMNSGQRIIEPRRCSFFGNTNETHILKNDTGTVRWICFEVVGFNVDKQYWKPESNLFVDINKVWAMAYALFKDGYDFQLSREELRENEAINEMYKEVSLEEQLVKMYLRPGPETKEYHMQTAEVMRILYEKEPILSKNLNINKVGTALKNNGFAYGQEYNDVRRYAVKGFYVTKN